VEFLGKTIFQNFFRGKLHFFSTFFFWGGGFSPKFSPEKMYEKLTPGRETRWRRQPRFAQGPAESSDRDHRHQHGMPEPGAYPTKQFFPVLHIFVRFCHKYE
jgi:hypothetical protein